MLLVYFWVKIPNGKIILIPFVFCTLSQVFKYLFLLLKKDKYIRCCNIIFAINFFLFWFGFLIYGTYIIICEKEYLMLLFTIPLWVVGIYSAIKIWEKINKMPVEN